MSHVLVTGANGFVGQALCHALQDAGHVVTGLVRRPRELAYGVGEWVDTSLNFTGVDEAWPVVQQIDCVVHLAARVHVMREEAGDLGSAFRATNVEGTMRVARAAWQHGVRRFVFVSSVKALAENDDGRPLREDDLAKPRDAYGCSKLAAEEALVKYGQEMSWDVVIVRPPLVYGPHVRANFQRLMDAIWKGVPLPLGAVVARRSLVYVDNLADALVRCAIDARAAGQCFHVADAGALTVAELARALGRHLQRPARLLPVPPDWLRLAGRAIGRSAYLDRLIGSLELDTIRIRDVLSWDAPFSIDEGLAATCSWYRSTH